MLVLFSFALLVASSFATVTEKCNGLPECQTPDDVKQENLHLLQKRMVITRARPVIPEQEVQEEAGGEAEGEDSNKDPAEVALAASQSSEGAKKHLAMDGCAIEGKWAPPSDKTGSNDMPPKLLGAQGKAALRCCSQNGRTCVSPRPCQKFLTWQQANAKCKQQGRRLCTKKELALAQKEYQDVLSALDGWVSVAL